MDNQKGKASGKVGKAVERSRRHSHNSYVPKANAHSLGHHKSAHRRWSDFPCLAK